MKESDALNSVALHFDLYGFGVQPHPQLARGQVRGQHPFQHAQSHLRFVTQPSDIARTGVQTRVARGVGRDVRVLPVELPDAPPECPVTVARAVVLDPDGFIGWDGLAGELSPNPGRLLGQNHLSSQFQGAEGRRHAAYTAPDDQDFGAVLFHPFVPLAARLSMKVFCAIRKASNTGRATSTLAASVRFQYVPPRGSVKRCSARGKVIFFSSFR